MRHRALAAVNEPIRIRCEGSGARSSYCPMCASGEIDRDGVIVEHERLDVLAMLDRGDFDGPAR